MTEARTVAPAATPEDEAIEASIRPKRLDEYLGQEAVREQMGIYIEAAKRRSEALDHVLIFGPPGLGKTTLSHPPLRGPPSSVLRTPSPASGRRDSPNDIASMRKSRND